MYETESRPACAMPDGRQVSSGRVSIMTKIRNYKHMQKLILSNPSLINHYQNIIPTKLILVMYFEEYDPPSSLIVPQHPLSEVQNILFIDVHNHQWNMSKENLAEVITEMDKLNMAVMVNLSGRGFTKVETEPGKF